jgi:hypothetical protein
LGYRVLKVSRLSLGFAGRLAAAPALGAAVELLGIVAHVEGGGVSAGELGEADPEAEPDDADEHGEIIGAFHRSSPPRASSAAWVMWWRP